MPFSLVELKAKALGILPQVLIALAMVGAIMWYSNKQFERGEKAADVRHEKLQAEIDKKQKLLEQKMTKDIERIGETLIEKNQRTDIQATETKTTIIHEIQSDPRLSDPEQGVTDEMLRQINKARAETK